MMADPEILDFATRVIDLQKDAYGDLFTQDDAADLAQALDETIERWMGCRDL